MGEGAWDNQEKKLPKTSYGNIEEDGGDTSEDQEKTLLIEAVNWRKVGGGDMRIKPPTQKRRR